MNKSTCLHRFIDQYSGKCLHCGYIKNDCSVDDQGLETEHYERLVLMLDDWKKNTIETN